MSSFDTFKQLLFPNASITVGHVIGWIAALLSITAFLPQSIKTMRTRKTEGISLSMYSLYIAANLCWIIWATLSIFAVSSKVNDYENVIFSNLTVIIPNIICTLITSIIFLIKLRNILIYKEGRKLEKRFKKHFNVKTQKVTPKFMEKLKKVSKSNSIKKES